MKNILHTLTILLVTLGAINWGLVGLFDINLVTMILRDWPAAQKALYVCIGLAGLVVAAHEMKEHL